LYIYIEFQEYRYSWLNLNVYTVIFEAEIENITLPHIDDELILNKEIEEKMIESGYTIGYAPHFMD
jgi:hypothetical protein